MTENKFGENKEECKMAAKKPLSSQEDVDLNQDKIEMQ